MLKINYLKVPKFYHRSKIITLDDVIIKEYNSSYGCLHFFNFNVKRKMAIKCHDGYQNSRGSSRARKQSP